MSERTDVDCVRNLVSMLIQAEQFGTSIAKTLRVHGDTLRTQRVQAVEAAAARTTIKLIFPLVLFIFPSLFVVVLGPRCFPSWIRSNPLAITEGRRNRYG
jgi:tight adherence protein C